MSRHWLLVLLLATGTAMAEEAAKPAAGASEEQAKTEEQAKKKEDAAKPAAGAAEAQANVKENDPDLGMSILGNQEAPKALVIVPWKSSEIGASLGISTMLDDSRQPIDKEVFMRVLNYYELMSKTTRQGGAPAGSSPVRPAPTAHGRKP